MIRFLFLFVLAAFLGCGPSSSPTRDEKNSAALRVNGVDLHGRDIDRVAKFVVKIFPNTSPEHAKTVALINTLIPQAVSLSHHRERIEPLRKTAEEARRRILAGEDFRKVAEELADFPPPPEAEESWSPVYRLDYLLGEWAFSLELGELSAPILTRNGWYLLRVKDRELRDPPRTSRTKMEAMLFSFEPEEEWEPLLRQWVEEADIQILDPEYERIVPEKYKFRTDARKWELLDPEKR